jgi:hypothetical protein
VTGTGTRKIKLIGQTGKNGNSHGFYTVFLSPSFPLSVVRPKTMGHISVNLRLYSAFQRKDAVLIHPRSMLSREYSLQSSSTRSSSCLSSYAWTDFREVEIVPHTVCLRNVEGRGAHQGSSRNEGIHYTAIWPKRVCSVKFTRC